VEIADIVAEIMLVLPMNCVRTQDLALAEVVSFLKPALMRPFKIQHVIRVAACLAVSLYGYA
jgi:hypothetical protein